MPSVFDLVATLSLDQSSYDRGIDEAKRSGVSSLGTGLKTAAKIGAAAIAGTTAAVGAFAVSSVRAGADFDAAMAQVAATMGVSVDQVQELNQFAQEMGRTTAFSATEAAQALNYMALAGYDADTSMKMLPTVLDLAAAGGMDLALASDMVTDAQSALGLSVEETTEMVDKMARASSKSNTSVAQLGEAFLTIGATARNVKGGTTELATVLGVLADNGIKGSEGGTHLRNMLLALQNPTDDAASMLSELGIQIYDADGQMRSMIDIIGDLNNGMEGLPQSAKDYITSQIFNKTDLAAVNALLGTRVDRFDELTESIEDAGGAAQAMADTQLDNLTGDITLMKSALEGAKIAVSNRLTPSLRTMVQFATTGISDITAAFDQGGATAAIEKFNDYVDQAVTAFTTNFPNILSSASTVIKGLAKTITKNLPGIIKGISDAVLELIRSFADFAPDLVSSAAEMFVGLVDGLTEALPSIVKGIAEAIPKIAEALIDHADEILVAGVELFATLGASIIEAIPQVVAKIPELLASIGKSILDGIGSLVSDIDAKWDGTATTISAAEQTIIDKLAEERAAMDETMAKRSEAIESIESEYGYYQGLWDELEKIVDENGKVKEGYEDRAQVITTVLSEATGEEIKLIDGTIQEYDKLRGSIESVILSQRAKALLTKDEELYAEAVNKVSDAHDTLVERQNAALDSEIALRDAQKRHQYLNKLLNSDLADQIDLDGKLAAENLELSETIIPSLTKEYDTQQAALQDAQSQYSDYMAVIDQHEGLMAAVAEGDVGKLNTAINNLTEDYRQATYATKEELETQHDNAVAHYEELKKAFESGNKTVTDQMIQDAINLVDRTSEELRVFEQNAPDITSRALELAKDEIANATAIAEQYMAQYRDGIEGEFDNLPSDLEAIADNAGSTFVKTYAGYAGEAYAASKNIANNITSALRTTLQIKSPSRVMKWIGKMIDEGLGIGIEDNAPIQEAENMVKGVIDAANGSIEDIGTVGVEGLNNGGFVINMTINGAEGQDVRELADIVSERIMAQVERRKAVFA